MKLNETDVLIVGAGIAGMLCASELLKQGRDVCVIDKGRQVGGRMATRRMGHTRVDHGAQFFTVRDPRFQCYVDEWLKVGVAREWFRHSSIDAKSEGHPRYCGTEGMTSICKYLAQDVTVHRSEQMVELFRDMDSWMVHTQSGARYSARHLVLTAPLPQSLLHLDTTGLDYAGEELARMRSVRYAKGLAVMAILDGPSGLPEPGGVRIDTPPLTWVADNQMKGISKNVSAITIHANAEFAALHWNSPDSVRGPLMLDAAEPLLASSVVDYQCHRWGFTLPINPLPYSCFHNESLGLTLAGDAFGGPRVEGAALSGIEASRSLGKVVN